MTAFDYIYGEVDGLSTLFVVPSIPEDAHESVREGIARRRLATVNGECPCGGRRPRLSRAQRRAAQRRTGGDVGSFAVEHEADCPAVAEATEAHIRGWRRST